MEGRHSGVEEYTTQIIRALIHIAPQHNYHLFYNSAGPVQLPNFGTGRVAVHGLRFPNKLLNTLQLVANTPKWNQLIGADIDVVFVPNTRLLPLSTQVPLVIVAHDLSFELFPEFLTLRRRVWHKLMRPRHLARSADHVIAVSDHTKQDLIDLYDLSPTAVSVVHSGVSAIPARAAQVQQLRRRRALPERFVLYLGTLEPRKNVASIVRAWSVIAPYIDQDLVIAGERGWQERDVLRAITASVHKSRIHRLGFVSESDRDALYAAADLFVYPSFYEGFGFPPLEALLAGTPVVTSFNSSLPEIVGRWATLVDPYNPSQLAAVMRELLSKPERVSDTIRAEIQETYSWDTAAKQTINILESVV